MSSREAAKAAPNEAVGLCTVHLDRPPEVVNAGVGLHGVNRPIDRYSLPDLWSLHLYAYSATLRIEGRENEIVPGHVSLVPPGIRTEYRYRGPSQHLYAHLRLSADGDGRAVPMLRPAGADLPVLTALLRSAVAAATASPERASAAVWAALWRLAEAGGVGARPGANSGSPHVATAVGYIDDHLAEPVTVPQIARAVGVSHNQLTRLFRAELGTTVVAHLRRRRLERARHLLRESTLPIAGVAAAVGVPDLQAFNKACRREYGISPRGLRAQRTDR